jgi:hypothetical protein
LEDDIAPDYEQDPDEHISIEMKAVTPLRQVYNHLISQSPKQNKLSSPKTVQSKEQISANQHLMRKNSRQPKEL